MRFQLDAYNQQNLSMAFTAQHAEDFPATSQAASALRQRVEGLISQGFPLNLDTMNYAYGQLVKDGTIKPMEKLEDEPIQPPPVLRGSGGETGYVDAEKMSDADLEKLLRSQGMLR